MFNAAICIVATLFIALPAEALNRPVPPKKQNQHSTESAKQSDDSAEKEDAFGTSRYFRFGLSGAFGRYRYEEDWGSGYPLNEIGRYQGAGIDAALELGRQWNSGFAFGAALQFGLFPTLKRFSSSGDTTETMESDTQNIKFFIVGLVFLHHPFGLENGFYFAIRPGISMMQGLRSYLPVPRPGFSIAMGYDFFNNEKAHLGVEAKVTAIFGKGKIDYDFSGSDISGRLISYGLAFTVAYY